MQGDLLVKKIPDTQMGIWIFWYTGRDSFAFSPVAKIKVATSF